MVDLDILLKVGSYIATIQFFGILLNPLNPVVLILSIKEFIKIKKEKKKGDKND